MTASATAEPRGYRRAALAVGVSAVLYVAAIAAWIARDAMASRRDAAWLSQPSVQIARLGAHAVVLALAGRDRAGRSGHFELILARNPIAWAHASADRLARGGEVLGSRAMGELADAALVDRLVAADHLVAIGSAEPELAATEGLYLAGQRARQTAVWLSGLAPGVAQITTLNLGQYRQPCALCETTKVSWARPVIVAAATSLEPGVDVGEALRAALGSAANVPAPARYTAYALARFR